MTDMQRVWVLGGVLCVGVLLYLLSPILMPFVVSALLAYLGNPWVARLVARGMGRSLAVSLVFTLLSLLLVLLLLLLVPLVEAQILHLIERMPRYLAWIRESLLPRVQGLLPAVGGALDLAALQAMIAEHWREAGGILSYLWSSVSGSGLAVLAVLVNMLLIPVLTFYLLRDWDQLLNAIRELLPRAQERVISQLAQESDLVLGAFLRGQVLVMLALGVIYTTGLWLVGLDLALLIGIIAGLVSFVPYLGLIVGILVAGVASVLQSQGFGDLPWVMLVFVVGQVLEGSVLTPRLVGERIGLHPVAVIFAVLAGGHLYGFFGILLALPVAAVAMVLLRHIAMRYRASSLYGPEVQPPAEGEIRQRD